MSGATGVMAGAAILGAGASIYGASKQGDAIDNANAANAGSVSSTNQANWNNYLAQRGLNTGGLAATGSIPGVPVGGAVNTRLPIWANITTTPAGGNTPRWVKKGTAGKPTYALTTGLTSIPAPATMGGGGNPFGETSFGAVAPSYSNGGYSMRDVYLPRPEDTATGMQPEPWRMNGSN